MVVPVMTTLLPWSTVNMLLGGPKTRYFVVSYFRGCERVTSVVVSVILAWLRPRYFRGCERRKRPASRWRGFNIAPCYFRGCERRKHPTAGQNEGRCSPGRRALSAQKTMTKCAELPRFGSLAARAAERSSLGESWRKSACAS